MILLPSVTMTRAAFAAVLVASGLGLSVRTSLADASNNILTIGSIYFVDPAK
jgi:hypothetical protein